jgi:hypothetical protein
MCRGLLHFNDLSTVFSTDPENKKVIPPLGCPPKSNYSQENFKFIPFLVKFTPFLRVMVKKRGRPAGSKNKTSTTRV